MKILTLFAQHHWTGPAEPEMAKLSRLTQMRHQVAFVFSRKPVGSLADVVQGYDFETLPDVELYRKRPSPWGFWKDLSALTAFAKKWQPDIIHCHLSHDHWAGVSLRARLGGNVTLVRTIHESRKLKRTVGDAMLHKRTDGIILPSIGFAEKLMANYGVDENRIQLVGGVVDENRFRPGLETESIRQEIGAPEDAPLVGIVSRIKPGRGHEELVAAFRKLADAKPDARLLIIGRGEGMETLVAQNVDLIKAGRLHFLGYRKDDLPNILNALSVKVLLGEGSDGTCRAVLEAMACALPVIGADLGVLPETITPGKTGWIVPPGDVDAIADAIDDALSNPEKTAAMGENARRQVLEKHTVEKAAEKALEFYQRIKDGAGA